MPSLDFNLKPRWNNLPRWIFLKCFSILYGGLVQLRSIAYRHRLISRWNAESRVISIGNITIGGTGKTPMVDWMLSFLSKSDVKSVVLTRGYKAQRIEKLQILNQSTAKEGDSLQFGDEPWLLFQNHPEATIYVSPDRVESARQAQQTADILILDDGMQHLRLNRDLEIVLIDAVSGIGNGQLIPLGPLREPLSNLKRADLIIYTKTNLESSSKIRQQLSECIPSCVKQFDSSYIVENLVPSDGSGPLNPDQIKGKKCLLFSGIGNPIGFYRTIEQEGAVIVDHLVFDDHQNYNHQTIDRIRQFASRHSFDFLICTEKDWVKLESTKSDLPLIYRLKMKMQIEQGFEQYLNRWLQK